jgi:type II pantothenate kinase
MPLEISSELIPYVTRVARKYWYLGVLGIALSMAGGYVGYLAEKELRLRRKKRLQSKKYNKVNIGAIFGMDVGGTLTKIVYFEKDTDTADAGGSLSNSEHDKSMVDVVTQDGAEGLQIQRAISHDSSDGQGLRRRFNKSESNFQADDVRERRHSLTGNEGGAGGGGMVRNTSIGGSLAKLDAPDHQAALKELYEYMDSTKDGANNAYSDLLHDQGLSIYSSSLGGRLHFLNFETRNMVNAIDVISMHGEAFHNVRTIACTGGGAHKYAKEVEEFLAVKFEQMDELHCLIRGMHFSLTNVVDECYTYRRSEMAEAEGVKEYTERVSLPPSYFMKKKEQFPYLVVNIGTGVSIMKITAPGEYERVSGSSVGGGTYWGLCRLLLQNHAGGAGKQGLTTGANAFQDILKLAEKGDPSKVDMLVKDIYGGSYEELSSALDGDMVASSFGKLTMKEDPASGVGAGDIAIALLMMITNNLGQVAYLNAQLHGCKKIFFVGSFLRQNQVSCRRLSYAIDFWSKGAMEALFLVHEGYFGALGTFLGAALGKDVDKILLTNEYLGGGGGSSNDNGGAENNDDDDDDATFHMDAAPVGRSRAQSASTILVGESRARGGLGGHRPARASVSTGVPSLAASHLLFTQSLAGKAQAPGARRASGGVIRPHEQY